MFKIQIEVREGVWSDYNCGDTPITTLEDARREVQLIVETWGLSMDEIRILDFAGNIR